ncbi:MAG: cbb3-type cytochrome oxidase assembly protein CcoS [Burkholderiales bacterium]|nr:cbb3-type cytochrome oxidase assembly protein CcoS [Burkholderiales bacterium]
MDILYLLVPLSVVLVLVIAGVLWHAVRSGQFDDLEGPGFKVLLDDDSPPEAVDAESQRTDRQPPEAERRQRTGKARPLRRSG